MNPAVTIPKQLVSPNLNTEKEPHVSGLPGSIVIYWLSWLQSARDELSRFNGVAR